MRFIEDLTIFLLRQKPFYAYVLAQMVKIEDPNIPVAAVSIKGGIPHFYYNEQGFKEQCVNREEMLGVLEHEVIHLIAGHTVRKGRRQTGTWNLACDFVVNQLVSYRLPDIALRVESHGLPPGLAVEEYYELLKKNQDSGNKKGGEVGDSYEAEEGDEGQVDGQISDGTNSRQDVNEDEENLEQKYKDLHVRWDESQEMPEELVEAVVKQMVRDAYEKSKGDIPESIVHIVEKSIINQVDWKKVMRMFVARTRARSRQPTWKKFNRRFPEDNPGYKKDYQSHVVVAIDTSGSINTQELSQFVGEINRMQKTKNKLTVIECDAAVQKIYELKRRDQLDLQFKGRGGTDFRPVFDEIRKMRCKPDAIIYLTDGYGLAPEKPFPVPTLWVITEKGKKPTEWGKEIRLHG